MPRVLRPAQFEQEHQQLVVVKKGVHEAVARVIERGHDQLYVHFLNTDKRLDDWVHESQTRALNEGEHVEQEPEPPLRGHKRKRSLSSYPQEDSTLRNIPNGVQGEDPLMTGGGDSSEEDDVAEHQLLTRRRNFDMVNFGQWQMKTWYFSPYPVTEAESDTLLTGTVAGRRASVPAQDGADIVAASNSSKPWRAASGNRSLHRTTLRSHGRTADMLAGGLNRDLARESGQASTLWVCDRCFKYMNEGVSYEIHRKICQYNRPPGRKVWGRGSRMIWELDGAVDKLYCQNLALFGKLFIDIKTLFFDTENFMFYVLTEGKTSCDIALGFFSKEKKSYDDYNLACIVIFPPYQRRGFGMLLVEFSYVLSRRSGMLGTPERPLSDLGLRGYLTYWISTLLRFFRFVLRISPSDLPGVQFSTPTDPTIPEYQDMAKKRQRASKASPAVSGGEDDADWSTLNGCPVEELNFTSMRRLQTKNNPDGSATTHISIRCTLDDISQATSLRPEDVAFALNECGLLQYRRDKLPGNDEPVVVLSREMVDQAAQRWKLRRSIILPKDLSLDPERKST